MSDNKEQQGTGMDGYRPTQKEYPGYGYQPPKNDSSTKPKGTPPRKP